MQSGINSYNSFQTIQYSHSRFIIENLESIYLAQLESVLVIGWSDLIRFGSGRHFRSVDLPAERPPPIHLFTFLLLLSHKRYVMFFVEIWLCQMSLSTDEILQTSIPNELQTDQLPVDRPVRSYPLKSIPIAIVINSKQFQCC
jgi:hypothetical protein